MAVLAWTQAAAVAVDAAGSTMEVEAAAVEDAVAVSVVAG